MPPDRASELAPPARWHRFVDHVGEVELQVGAEDLGGLLAQAALALGELLLGPARAPSGGRRRERAIEVRSIDREALVVDWLNEILFLAETELWVPLEIEVKEASATHVRALGRGVAVPRPPTLVKAATLHGLAVRDEEGGVRAEVVLDV